ncbi:MAG: hypothetical protein AAF843_02215 [Bacteroidota bacterium]
MVFLLYRLTSSIFTKSGSDTMMWRYRFTVKKYYFYSLLAGLSGILRMSSSWHTLLQMAENRFLNKFQSKNSNELERIAKNSNDYVIEARQAAAQLLKQRDSESKTIDTVEQEVENQRKSRELTKAQIESRTENIIKRLKSISLKETRKYSLRNGNELQIKRLKESRFQVRIEAYRSMLTPVMILDITSDKTFKTFPFFYIKSLLIFGLGGPVVSLILTQLNFFQVTFWEAILFPPITVIGLQILTVPTYYANLKFLKETLGK